MMLFPQFLRIKQTNRFLLIAIIIFYHVNTGQAQTTRCADDRQFYTKFISKNELDDTSVFVPLKLFERSPGLNVMSSTDKNGNELECKIASFTFILMRGNNVLYSHQYDTVMPFTTFDTLRTAIDTYEIRQGDILIFTDIRVKYYCNPCNGYCYDRSLPMLKVVDNYKTYPHRMYMNVSSYLKRQEEERIKARDHGKRKR